MSDVNLEDIVSLCKRRGFIYRAVRFTAAWLARGTMGRSASSSNVTS